MPFDQGENFAFLGGKDWDPSQVTLPKPVIDALEILLITKDNLAGYHRELVEHFILEEKWGRWIGRWTAEEHLHAIALRNYLVVTREIDPTANEDVRVEHVMKGFRADTYTQIETLVFMAFFERAHAVFCRNLAGADRGAGAEVARRADRHATRSATRCSSPTWSRTAWSTTQDETVAAIARRAAELSSSAPTSTPTRTRSRPSPRPASSTEASCAGDLRRDHARWGLAEHPDLSSR